VASNLQGAATLVGDTTSILLGSYASMDFLDFFWFMGKPGIFWVVQISCVSAIALLLFIFRNMRQSLQRGTMTPVDDKFPTLLMAGLVTMLICASFLPGKPEITNGLICTGLFAVGLLRELFHGRFRSVANAVCEIDFSTLILLAALFVIISAITCAGVIDAISQVFIALCGSSLFAAYTIIVCFSVFASAFVDNIPYVATMLPVVSVISSALDVQPYILYYGLLVGATLGGNLTPIGASANITAIGILEKNGFQVKSSDFMKIGVPFTLAAVITGYILLWLIWI
jgi:Na+/H+ antiporter NhaD/arsenite permease-like protein